MSSYAKYSSSGSGSSIPIPVPIADGGTNSTTALNNGLIMVSAGGAIVESGLGLNTAASPNMTLATVGSGNGNSLSMTAGTGVVQGGNLNLTAGLGGSANGGTINAVAGASSSASAGGVFNGTGGANTSTGNGGSAQVTGGAAVSGTGGNGRVRGGSATAGTGGGVQITGGNVTSGAGAGGTITLGAGVSAAGTGGSIVLQTGNSALTTWLTLDPSGSLKYQNYHVEPSQQSVTVSGASTAVDLSLASAALVTLGASTTLTLSNPQTGGAYVFEIVQGAAAYTVAWPVAVKWPNGVAPIISTANAAVDKVTLYYDGSIYLGTFAQNFS